MRSDICCRSCSCSALVLPQHRWYCRCQFCCCCHCRLYDSYFAWQNIAMNPWCSLLVGIFFFFLLFSFLQILWKWNRMRYDQKHDSRRAKYSYLYECCFRGIPHFHSPSHFSHRFRLAWRTKFTNAIPNDAIENEICVKRTNCSCQATVHELSVPIW